MKQKDTEELGPCIVTHKSGKRVYIRDRLRQMKKQLEQAPYDHYYQDRDEANAAYEEYERERREGALESDNACRAAPSHRYRRLNR